MIFICLFICICEIIYISLQSKRKTQPLKNILLIIKITQGDVCNLWQIKDEFARNEDKQLI